jgi:hypothetical protein
MQHIEHEGVTLCEAVETVMSFLVAPQLYEVPLSLMNQEDTAL